MNQETRSLVEASLNQTFVGILLRYQNVSMSDLFNIIDAMRSLPTPEPAAPPPAPKAATTRPTKLPKKAPEPPKVVPDLRTQRGRDSYDQQVLAALIALGGTDVAARTVGSRVPGDDEQRRTSLKRLMKAGKVSMSGQKAATRYSVVAPAEPQP